MLRLAFRGGSAAADVCLLLLLLRVSAKAAAEWLKTAIC
jgi:hypothetical protein